MLAGVWTWVRLPPAPLYFKNVEILNVFLLVCLFPTFPLSNPIITTRLTGGLHQGYKPKLPASA